MALEIERKFLVKNDAWRGLGTTVAIRQGYLSRDVERTVRVRTKDDKGFLTIKGKNNGAVRTEFEYPIPHDEADAMLDTLALRPIIEKTRTKIEYAGKLWEVDCFFGENDGLVLAEVELASETESVALPEWIGDEVTHLPRYYNSSLSEHPYSLWSDEEKAQR